ncbi:MAG: NYN domain-containing protein [Terracidiphilus sp.]|jgi:uncharacterized LabA/DUF88 family protein
MFEPALKRVFAFIDGQNLFHQVKDAFGYRFPNYDVAALTRVVCGVNGWQPTEVRFYTGIHDATANPFQNAFWVSKTAQMGQVGVKVITRPLRYRNKSVRLPDGTEHTFLAAEEKGIDVRIALDVIAGARSGAYDVGIIFSQDQDLAEVASEIRTIAREQGRWIKIASAFPDSPTARNRRGINNTDWIRIDRGTYDRCIDPRDYRP